MAKFRKHKSVAKETKYCLSRKPKKLPNLLDEPMPAKIAKGPKLRERSVQVVIDLTCNDMESESVESEFGAIAMRPEVVIVATATGRKKKTVTTDVEEE